MNASTSHIKPDELIYSVNQSTGFYRVNDSFVTFFEALEFQDYVFK